MPILRSTGVDSSACRGRHSRAGRRGRRGDRAVGLERLEARAMLAVSAWVDENPKTNRATLFVTSNADNDTVSFVAKADSYEVSGTGLAAKTFLKSAVGTIQFNDTISKWKPQGSSGQSLFIEREGPAVVNHPLDVNGFEQTFLNASIDTDFKANGVDYKANKSAGTGDISFGGPVRLATGATVSIATRSSTAPRVTFSSTVDGAGNLSVSTKGNVTFSGKVGGTIPVKSLSIPKAGVLTGSQSVAINGTINDGKGPAATGLLIGEGVLMASLVAPGSSVKGCVTGILVEGNSSPKASRSIKNFTVTENDVGLALVRPVGPVSGQPNGDLRNITISSNVVSKNASHGIFVGGDIINQSKTTAVVVSQNVILDNGGDGIRVEGSPTDLLIEKNMLAGNGDAAIRVTNGVTGPQWTNNDPKGGPRIDANSLAASSSPGATAGRQARNGIVVQDMAGVQITKNYVNGFQNGIALAGRFASKKATLVSGNTVVNSSRAGIDLVGATFVTIDATNKVSDGFIGLRATDSSAGTKVAGMAFTNNATGIDVFWAPRLTIEGVKVSGGGVGIKAAGAGFQTTISGTVTSASDAGVWIDRAFDGLTVQKTTVTKSGVGLRVTGVSSGAVVSGCTFAQNVGSGIELVNAGNMLLSSPVSQFNGGAALWASGEFSAYQGGVGSGVSTTKTQVLKGTFKGNGGVRLEGATNLIIKDAAVSSGLVRGVTLQRGLSALGDCTGSSFVGGTITAATVGIEIAAAKGLAIGGTSILSSAIHGVWASGACAKTAITGTTIKGSGQNGVLLAAASGISLGGNAILSNPGNGISATGACTGSTIVGNTISGSGKAGILLANVTNVALSGNSVTGSAGNGLDAAGACTGTTVTGSNISSNKQSGVVLAGVTGLTLNGGNTINANAVNGVSASGASAGTALAGNTISANGKAGLLLKDAANLALAANTVSGNTGNGLDAAGACTGTTVTGSTFSTNKQSGIVLAAASGLTFTGNTINANAADGFSASGACTGSKASGNTIATNANAGLKFDAAQSITVTGNTLTGNKVYGLYATGVSTGTVVTANKIAGSKTNIAVTATGGTFQKTGA